ncbi:MAG: cell envelope integrity protein TolA [Gammaproteobacteria bacterium]|nr:cell envelope integrity protein TolA [Gammaproteobacteria bacterium]
MADTVRAYSAPLVLALLVHLAAVTALHDGWLPGAQPEGRVIKPNLVQSQLIVMQPKARPEPKPAPPKPAAEVPKVAEPEPQAKPEPRRDREAERRQREAAEALERQQRRLAELAQDSFTQALAEEASELAADQDLSAAQSFRFGIYQRVVANWSRPPSARNGMQARLLVELIPTGAVVGVTVVESSGNSAFDRSAEAAVRKARAFDVPPESDLFERHFRRFSLLFKPEDLLR